MYEYPGPDAPIRQGDIFVGLPRVEVSLGRIPVVEDDETRSGGKPRPCAPAAHLPRRR